MDFLSSEVIGVIFMYLDNKSLLNCTLVCKRWNEISANLLQIAVDQITEGIDNVALVSQVDFRKYKKYKLASITDETETVLAKIGSNMKALVIEPLIIDELTLKATFEFMLNACASSLQQLVISNMHLNHFPEWEVAYLKSIKSVKLDCVPAEFFRAIDLTHAKSIKACTIEDGDGTLLLNALKQPKNLFELAVRDACLHEEMMQIDWRLKKLSLLNIFSTTEKTMKFFLQSCSKFVEYLEFQNFATPLIYGYIFKEFTQLKVLKLKISEIGENDVFQYEKNLQVRSLLLDLLPSTSDLAIGRVIQFTPNVEELCILSTEMIANTTVISIATQLPKLRTLHLSKANGDIFRGAEMINLKAMRIMDGLSNIQDIPISCPNLENFRIDYGSIQDLEHISSLKKLATLTFGQNVIASYESLTYLADNCENFKSLTMYKEEIETDSWIFEHLKNKGISITLLENALPNILIDNGMWGKKYFVPEIEEEDYELDDLNMSDDYDDFYSEEFDSDLEYDYFDY